MAGRDRRGRVPFADRLLELVAVLLLGLATVATAWCGYQSSRWSTTDADLSDQASRQQVEAARLFGAATQRVAYDSTIAAQYAEARVENKPQLLAFYRETLVRPALRPVLARWEAEITAGRAPTRLTDDKTYLAGEFRAYDAALVTADGLSRSSAAASARADSYTKITILLAAALFFAGVAPTFTYRPARVLLLLAATLTIAYAGSQLATLPVG